MRHLTFIIAPLCWLTLTSAILSQERSPVDWIFVIDRSQSMVGKGGSANIFPDVQRAVKRFTDITINGDSVTIINYAETVSDPESIYIGGQTDKNHISNKTDSLRADGRYTHTGEAIQRALERQRELQTPLNPKRSVCIIILTDGIEDTADNPGAIRLEDVHIPPPGRRPYTIFVWLGKSEEEFRLSSLAKLKKEMGSDATLLLHPNGQNIQVLSEEVRNLIAPRVTVLPGELDFRIIEPGEATEAKVLRFTSSKPTRLTLDFSETTSPSLVLEEPIEAFVADTTLREVKVKLRAGEQTKDGLHKATLLIREHENFRLSPSSNTVLARVPVRITVESPSIWALAARWLTYSLAFFVMAIVCACIYYQDFPPELYKRWRRRGTLFGVLEPHSGNRQSVDLSYLRARSTSLASILGSNHKSTADVEFSTIKEDGRARVVLQNAQGPILLNGKPLHQDSVVEIFNGDEITANGQSFTYHGPERP